MSLQSVSDLFASPTGPLFAVENGVARAGLYGLLLVTVSEPVVTPT